MPLMMKNISSPHMKMLRSVTFFIAKTKQHEAAEIRNTYREMT